jgi:hypothetical protein
MQNTAHTEDKIVMHTLPLVDADKNILGWRVGVQLFWLNTSRHTEDITHLLLPFGIQSPPPLVFSPLQTLPPAQDIINEIMIIFI